MSNYHGQEEQEDRTPVDGAMLFEERHRKAARQVLATGKPDFDLNRDLHVLAHQHPFPSHQAAFYLNELAVRGLSLLPAHDHIMSEAWTMDEAGYPHLAQVLLLDAGVRYEFCGDGR